MYISKTFTFMIEVLRNSILCKTFIEIFEKKFAWETYSQRMFVRN